MPGPGGGDIVSSDTPEGACREFSRALRQHFNTVRPLSDREVALLCQHYLLFDRWNRVINLSSVRDLAGVVLRHYCESLYLATHLPQGGLRIVDLGTGAGFPGVPVAILRPDCEVLLAEGHQRKAAFLKEATRRLPNVSVFAGRVQGAEGSFDWMISRAVAWRKVREEFLRLANCVALLVSQPDADAIRRDAVAHWEVPLRLPWGRHQVLLCGERST